MAGRPSAGPLRARRRIRYVAQESGKRLPAVSRADPKDVHVNDATPQDEALAPFGGIGQSGLGGRSGGDANIEESTERRWLTVNSAPAHYPY